MTDKVFFFVTSGKISPWTGRFYSLLDPSYAKNNIPIIASVSEHQPTTWSSYYFDLQLLVFMFPGKCALNRNTQSNNRFRLHGHSMFNVKSNAQPNVKLLIDSYLLFPYSWSLLLL